MALFWQKLLKSLYFGQTVCLGQNGHTLEYDFMLRTMKQDITKAVQFSITFRYIDDLLSVNNENFGNYISDIYPSDLELKGTTLTSNEV